MSDQITPADISRFAANESIISAVLKWAAANGRRLSKADLERMGAGVDAMVEENARLTKERDEALALLGCYKMDKDDLKARIKRLEEAGDKAILNSYLPDRLAVWHKAKEDKL
jgi:phospholipase/lecithinase/hemolysin